MEELKFETLEKLLMRRLNLVYHSSIDTSPHILMFGTNPFDGTKVNNTELLIKKANDRTLKQNLLENEKTNKKRKI